jgi:hypothetical protein
MTAILKKAKQIIEKAKTDEDFFFDNGDQLIATGERSVDYSLYCFDLSDEYYLLIDFVDFAFEDFSIVHKNHYDTIVRLQTEEQAG